LLLSKNRYLIQLTLNQMPIAGNVSHRLSIQLAKLQHLESQPMDAKVTYEVLLSTQPNMLVGYT
jgi:hypothetical protein